MSGHRIAKVTTLFQGWRKVVQMHVELPNGGTMDREVVDSGSAAAVLPYDLERRTVILIRQFRAAVMYSGGPEMLLEAVAGLLDGNDPETCARRESMEEAGLQITTLEPLGAGWSAPGATTELIHLFLAPYTPEDRVSEGGGLAEEQENIEVVEYSFAEIAALLKQNAFQDFKTLALVQALMLRHPNAFAD